MPQDGAVLVVAEVRAIYDEESFKTYQLGARAQLRRHGGTVVGRGTLMFEGSEEHTSELQSPI